MEFEPATFAAYDQPVPPGEVNPPSPYDATDTVYAAARMLCANGGQNGANLNQAVYDYKHSQAYVTEVLDLAQTYGQTEAQTVAAGTAGGIAADWSLAQVGTPYVWGGETPASASTAPASSKPPTRSPGSACPALPKTSMTPPPSSDPATLSNPVTWSFSAAVPPTSPTPASTLATGRWSTPPTPTPTCGLRPPRRRPEHRGAATSSSGSPTRPQAEASSHGHRVGAPADSMIPDRAIDLDSLPRGHDEAAGRVHHHARRDG